MYRFFSQCCQIFQKNFQVFQKNNLCTTIMQEIHNVPTILKVFKKLCQFIQENFQVFQKNYQVIKTEYIAKHSWKVFCAHVCRFNLVYLLNLLFKSYTMFFLFIKIWQSEVEYATCLKFYFLQNPYITSTFYFSLLHLTLSIFLYLYLFICSSGCCLGCQLQFQKFLHYVYFKGPAYSPNLQGFSILSTKNVSWLVQIEGLFKFGH